MKISCYCLIAALFMFFSCKSNQNLIYFNDLKESEYKTKIESRSKPRIQADDMLAISVSTLSPESNALFNSGVLQAAGRNAGAGAGTANDNGYLVDEKGFINFPVVGQIRLAGLTKEQAAEELTSAINKFVKKPIVNVRFIDFKISVIGEVNRPSTFTIATDKINILQALALAGDLTTNGKRENIALIREREGVRSVVRVNLNNKETLSSPYFYLQQNDIVYVEPDKAKTVQTSLARNNFQYALSIGLSIVSVLSIFLIRF